MATKKAYAEQLKDPRWQRKRLEMLEAAQWKCSSCGNGDDTLHVHHKLYLKGKMPWEYDNSLLAVLCDACHKDEHDAEEMLKIILAGANFHMAPSLVATGLIGGYMYGAGCLHSDYADAARDFSPIYFKLGILAQQLAVVPLDDLCKAVDQLPPDTFKSHAHDELMAWLRREAAKGD